MIEYHKDYGSILPCGGKGTRLRSLTQDLIPKSLLKINGKELIRYSIDSLDPDIIKRIVFAVDHRADDIRAWVNRFNFPYFVEFSEQEGVGVLDSIACSASHVEEDSIVACNTDEVRCGINLANIIRFHESHGQLATIVATYTNRLYRHRIMEVREKDNLVINTELKPTAYINHPEVIGLVNTGLVIIERQAMEYFDPAHSKDWGGIIDPLCDAGQLNAYVDKHIAYFNVGTPEEYMEAQDYLKQNVAYA